MRFKLDYFTAGIRDLVPCDTRTAPAYISSKHAYSAELSRDVHVTSWSR